MSVFIPKGTKNYYYSFMVGTKTFKKSCHTTSKTKAQAIERKVRAEAEAHILHGETKPITLRDAIDSFVKFKKYDKKNVGWASLYRVVGETTSAAEFKFDGDTLIHTITSVDLTTLVHSRMEEDFSSRTITHEIGYLRRCFDHLGSLGFKTPVNIKYPKLSTKNTRVRFLTDLEVDQLLFDLKQSQNPDNADLCIMLLDLGCRHSEATTLPWSAVDFKNKTISLYRPKVNNTSVIPMTSRLHRVLLARFETRVNRFVFSSADKKSHKQYNPSWFNLAAERIGLNTPEKIAEYGHAASIHTLRHTTSSKLIQNGCNLSEVAAILGHSPNSNSTKIYAHLVKSDVLTKAVGILDKLNEE